MHVKVFIFFCSSLCLFWPAITLHCMEIWFKRISEKGNRGSEYSLTMLIIFDMIWHSYMLRGFIKCIFVIFLLICLDFLFFHTFLHFVVSRFTSWKEEENRDICGSFVCVYMCWGLASTAHFRTNVQQHYVLKRLRGVELSCINYSSNFLSTYKLCPSQHTRSGRIYPSQFIMHKL